MNPTPEPITPLDIECPTCGANPRVKCASWHAGLPPRNHPHNARIAAAERINKERRRKERAK